MRPSLSYLGSALAGFLSLAGAKAQTVPSLADLTGPWQLLVDDYLISAQSDVVRTYHPFQKYAANPVMTATKAWEGSVIYVYGTVLPNESGGGYRMWYHCLPTDVKYRLCYATSTNGISWVKPSLNIVTYAGSKRNNIFIQRSGQDHIPSVIHTPWETDPLRRYKLINFDGVAGRFLGASSGDGIHWTDSSANPILPPASDVGNFVWDPHAARYAGYMKVAAYVRGLRRRAVGFTATATFDSLWPAPYLVLAPDDFDDRWASEPQRTHFYGLCGFAYETMYLGFLWVFRATDITGYNDGTIFVELVTSRDGIHWQREQGDRPPFLPLGAPGAWDDGMVFTTQQPLVEGGTIRLYYGGIDGTHYATGWHGAIGLATLRKDGFASLDAGATTGTITTRRLQGATGQLRVNYASSGGWLKVEVLDASGNVLPGYGRADCAALQGDSVDQVVTWNAHTQLPGGADPVRLRFLLQNASLFSFMAGTSVQVIDDPQGPILGTLYLFERNMGTWASDRLSADGRQTLVFRGNVAVDANPANAAFGERSVAFGAPGTYSNRLEIAETANLGKHFTLAAMVNALDERHARLFSTYSGTGSVRCADLIFDFDPTGAAIPGLQLTCQGIAVQSLPVTFADGRYHHLAVTYDEGEVRFYLDGVPAGQAWLPGGEPVSLSGPLGVGGDDGIANDQQFIGHIDDLLVLGRALDAGEVAALYRDGAEIFFGVSTSLADFDSDGDVDVEDTVFFNWCFNGPNRPPLYPECFLADLDGDIDIDLADFNLFQACFNGPNRPSACP